MKQLKNLLLTTDAYKASHFKQLPANSDGARFYIAPRKPLTKTEKEFIVFGISYFIETYLRKPITLEDITYARKIYSKFNVLGKQYPFPYDGFLKIVNEYNGYLPINIYGVKEGEVKFKYNTPIAIIEVFDKDLVWLPGFIETAFQRAVWYGSTVATNSRNVRKLLDLFYFDSVDPDNYWTLDSRLHDFGARGVSSGESAALGGLAHLINFNGTDTMEAVVLGIEMYNIEVQDLASSIPAAEHSTVTSWGPYQINERQALDNMIDKFTTKEDTLFAFVSDSYDYKKMVDQVWGDPEIIERIKETGKIPVVRPDSGDPVEMVLYALNSLEKTWGVITNKKGYRILDGIRIIQGDGMDYKKIKELYSAILNAGFSAENVAVGMGGGLLQKLDRDSMSWSMKMFQIRRDGIWINVMKNPKTQESKKGWNPNDGVNIDDWVTYYNKTKNISNFPEARLDFKEIRGRARI